MKATLEFTSEEVEADELDMALNGSIYKMALLDINEALRARAKYAQGVTNEEADFIRGLREIIGETLND